MIKRVLIRMKINNNNKIRRLVKLSKRTTIMGTKELKEPTHQMPKLILVQ
jgi:hypothetical protein